jgi:hypothetical protein
MYVQLYSKFPNRNLVAGTGNHFQFAASLQGGDFTLSTPPPQTVPAGQSVNGIPETISPVNGFNTPVNLAWTNSSSWPTGLSASFGQDPVTSSTTISLTTTSGTPAGTYTLAFSGTGGGRLHTSSFTVQVGGFNWQPMQDVRLIALDTGDVYGYFSNWVQSSDYCCWTNLMQNAQISGPGGNSWGPSSGSSTTDTTPSIVSFPAFSLADRGFGVYNFAFTASFSYNQSTPFIHPQVLSYSYPTPSVTSLSPAFGLPGTTVGGVTINGVGLGALDLDITQYRGLTGVNLSGNGVTASSFTQGLIDPAAASIPDTATSVQADIAIDPSAVPGGRQLSVTAFGYTTNSVTFSVSDATPVIYTVQQLAPLYPGGAGLHRDLRKQFWSTVHRQSGLPERRCHDLP